LRPDHELGRQFNAGVLVAVVLLYCFPPDDRLLHGAVCKAAGASGLVLAVEFRADAVLHFHRVVVPVVARLAVQRNGVVSWKMCFPGCM
jgi:hypothetical protein